jgi:hypothetical protein
MKYIDYSEKGGIVLVALGLILFGFLFLLRNLGYIHGDMWNFVWPLIFILIGVSLVLKGMGKS